MALTFGEFKALVAPYVGRAGRCADDAETSRFARGVMESLLYSGSTSAIRKLCVLSQKGCVVLPPEVEVPLKVRIDHQVAEVWSKWFSIHSTTEGMDGCYPAGKILIEDGAQTPLVYEMPPGPNILGVMSSCEEPADACIYIQGKDVTGREIYSTHKGQQVTGIKLSLLKNEIRYNDIPFGQITAVKKTKTNGYIQLFSLKPDFSIRQFLADWSPSDERPMYRKYKVISSNCPAIAHLSILCRVKIKDNYTNNELTLFDNSHAIMLAAQRVQAEVNNDTQTANYKMQAVDDLLEREAAYKKPPGGKIDVFYPLSAGTIKGLVR